MFVRTDEKVLKTQGLCGVGTGETLPAKDCHGKFLFPKSMKTAPQKLSHKNGILGAYITPRDIRAGKHHNRRTSQTNVCSVGLKMGLGKEIKSRPLNTFSVPVRGLIGRRTKPMSELVDRKRIRTRKVKKLSSNNREKSKDKGKREKEKE